MPNPNPSPATRFQSLAPGEKLVQLRVRIPQRLMQALLQHDDGTGNFSATVREVLDAGITVLDGRALDWMEQQPDEIDGS